MWHVASLCSVILFACFARLCIHKDFCRLLRIKKKVMWKESRSNILEYLFSYPEDEGIMSVHIINRFISKLNVAICPVGGNGHWVSIDCVQGMGKWWGGYFVCSHFQCSEVFIDALLWLWGTTLGWITLLLFVQEDRLCSNSFQINNMKFGGSRRVHLQHIFFIGSFHILASHCMLI